jgi:hypothetical protein
MMRFTIMIGAIRKPVGYVYAHSTREAVDLVHGFGLSKSFDVTITKGKLPLPTLCPAEMVCATPDELATEPELEARATLEATDAH